MFLSCCSIVFLGVLFSSVMAISPPLYAQGLGLGLGLGLNAPTKTYDHSLDSKLVAAVKAGQLDEVQKLLKQGADPNAKDTDKYTSPVLALSASENFNLEVLQSLLAAGANTEVLNAQGATPLILASVDSHVESVKALLKTGAKVEAASEDGLTALMVAASAGEIENVRVLLAAGANVNALSKSKGTPLIYGSSKTIAGTGTLEIIKTLVDAGADVGVTATNGKNARATAKDYGLADIADYLLTIEQRDSALFDAMAHAYSERKTPNTTAWEAVKTALDAGANPHFTQKDGRTELMFLAYGIPGCDEATLKRFVAKSDLAAQEQQFGATALHLAVENNNLALVSMLLKAGAPREVKTKDGRTPFDIAMAKKDILMIAEFTAIGKDGDDDDENTIPYFV